MFRRAIMLPFKLLGIPVKLDTSFLLILPLFTFLIGSQIPAYVQIFARGVDASAIQQGVMPYFLGLVAAIGLFASVLIHELGHAVTARFYGVETKEITLWFLGGLARFDEMPKQKGAEAVTAIAGPITSFVLAAVFFILYRNTDMGAAMLFMFGYLMTTNFALALFNLLPALPLDGGRVLRSLLALRFGQLRATQISGNVSRFFAVALGIYGIISFQIFIVVIAFFIYNAVAAETRHATITEGLSNMRVADLMTREVDTVYPDMPLSQFAKLMFYKHHTGYPVVNFNDELLGFAKLQDAQEEGDNSNVDPVNKTVSDIIEPAETVFESELALELLKRLPGSSHGRYVVLNDSGDMVGILSKTDLLKAIQPGRLR